MKKNKVYYLLAFLIPLLLMLIIYMTAGIYPFGNKSLLTVDMAGQYIAFFNALKNIFNGAGSIFYSFSKTLGGNMFGLITYYLISPFNFIIMFFDRINITEAILCINLLKIASCGLTSYIYFRRTFKDKTGVPLVFSIVYALMAYNIVYSQNIMWLDGVILLPLVFMGIDKLVSKRKPTMFFITLTLSIFCNYYIGYMTCIGSLIYFLYKLYLNQNCSLSIKKDKKEIIYFFKYALLSVGVSMVILLPSIFSLLVGKAGAGLTEFIPKQTYAVMDLISRFAIGSFNNADLAVGSPNVFISLMMIVLVICYFFNKKINRKEKKGSFIVLCVFGISFVFYSVDLIWHTFQHPAGFPFRYSFIFDLFLLIIAYKSYKNIKEIDNNILKKIGMWTLILTVVIDKVMYTTNMYYHIIASGIVIIIYLAYLFYSKDRKLKFLISSLMVIEMIINGIVIVNNMNYQLHSKYTDFVNTYGTVVDEIKESDNSFYRMEKDYSYTTNDPLLLNYNGISHFSSTYEGDNNSLLGDYLGIFNRFYITNYLGSTMVTNSLFDIKYVILEKEFSNYELIGLKDDMYIYKNQYSLPLGFMVNDELKTLKLDELEAFDNQNSIIKKMINSKDNVFVENIIGSIELNNVELDDKITKNLVYKQVNTNIDASIIYHISVQKDGPLYVYFASDYNKKVDILVDGKSIIDTSDQNSYRYNILDLGNYQKGDKVDVEVLLLDGQFKIKEASSYSLDMALFEKSITKLQDNNAMVIEENNDSYIKAKIKVDEDDGILYTSIPYDNAWKIKVDSKTVKPIKILNSFIGLDLGVGDHEIEFSYVPRGLKAGAIISLMSFITFLILRKRKD